MNKQHKQSEAIQAMMELKLVDFLNPSGKLWKTWARGDVTPFDCPDWQWRVKPEPKPDVVRYGFALPTWWGNVLCPDNNIKITFDGETGKLKSAEVIS